MSRGFLEGNKTKQEIIVENSIQRVKMKDKEIAPIATVSLPVVEEARKKLQHAPSGI